LIKTVAKRIKDVSFDLNQRSPTHGYGQKGSQSSLQKFTNLEILKSCRIMMLVQVDVVNYLMLK